MISASKLQNNISLPAFKNKAKIFNDVKISDSLENKAPGARTLKAYYGIKEKNLSFGTKLPMEPIEQIKKIVAQVKSMSNDVIGKSHKNASQAIEVMDLALQALDHGFQEITTTALNQMQGTTPNDHGLLAEIEENTKALRGIEHHSLQPDETIDKKMGAAIQDNMFLATSSHEAIEAHEREIEELANKIQTPKDKTSVKTAQEILRQLKEGLYKEINEQNNIIAAAAIEKKRQIQELFKRHARQITDELNRILYTPQVQEEPDLLKTLENWLTGKKNGEPPQSDSAYFPSNIS